MTDPIFDAIARLRAAERPFALATVVETRGSVSAKTGAKAVVDERGRVVAGWVGGGCAESSVCLQARESLKTGEPALLELDLDDEVLGTGMPCGGHMRVYVEAILPRPRLWILGHGRVAECLASLGETLGLATVVHDPDPDPERWPAAARLIPRDPDYALLAPGPGDFVVVATQHKGDHRSLLRVLASEARYVALIASRKRARLVLDWLRAEGLGESDLERVMAPAGLDLGARTPEEIALSVMSEIVLVRRGGSGGRMGERPRGEPLAGPATVLT